MKKKSTKNKKKSKINFAGILIEAVFIFLSVYGAFLLEDKRTRDNNTKVLIEKLLQLKEEIERDSLRFVDMIQPPGQSRHSLNIPSTLKADSIVIEHLLRDNPNRLELVLEQKNTWLFISQHWIEESPTYDFLIRNYLQNIKLRETELLLESYFRTRRAILNHNANYQINYDRMTIFFDESIPLQDPTKMELRKINTPIWQNTVAKNAELLKKMQGLIETLSGKASATIRALKSEVEAQKN